MLIRRLFRSDSYNLIEARTGNQGLTIAESQALDLILMDINLPDIDGYEITRRLRSSAKTTLAEIPIIVITANAMKGDAQKAVDAGCDVYMSKPINIIELMDTVEAFVCKEY
jgi:two-component system cell cycle response regulator DivK